MNNKVELKNVLNNCGKVARGTIHDALDCFALGVGVTGLVLGSAMILGGVLCTVPGSTIGASLALNYGGEKLFANGILFNGLSYKMLKKF